MDFLTLDPDSFTYGTVVEVLPGIRRVIAENPSKFTYHGTGTYLVGRGDSVAVIDPGPELDSHRDALAAALDGDHVRAVLVTHCHADHSPLSAWLAADTGAPTVAFGPHGDDDGWDIGSDEAIPAGDPEPARRADDEPADLPQQEQTPAEVEIEEAVDRAFSPDLVVGSGDPVASGPGWAITALHTPGHTSNHTCFVYADADRSVLFSGDHVMGWSTTVVAPPDGDMAAYFESLRVVAGRHDDVALPTHGPPIPAPARYVDELIRHRLDRERSVLARVRAGDADVASIVAALYQATPLTLHRAAGRSVLAHLVKLVAEGDVVVVGGGRPRLDGQFDAA